jgi:hypothetical protein
VHRVLALHFDENSAARYAEYNVNTQAWSEGIVPAGELATAVDLSLAYDPQTQGSVAAVLRELRLDGVQRDMVAGHNREPVRDPVELD